ncbi:DEAD/DEAH box helicase [Dactylosporangium salmoneum]|uniref:Helicase ATP-binding domain-containing protein n=1 Tax=Dactylosporangium salmoneum TaxID=53361 RepID=A0ABP5SV54_9ACTN
MTVALESDDRPAGRVGVDRRGRPVVHRPDVSDGSWQRICALLRPAADVISGSAVVLDRDRIRALDRLLARHPATTVAWRWDDAARRLQDRAARTAASLDDLMSRTVEEQAAWPVDLDRELIACGYVRELRPFQRESVARLLAAGGGANFSVPGSGKTAVTYALFAALRARREVHAMLVVAPPSAFEAWRQEAEQCFAPGAVPRVTVRPPVPTRHDTVVVLNYEQLGDPAVRTRLDAWARSRTVLTVFDEAHRAKAGEASHRGADAADLARRSGRTLVLTGTPMPNSLSDLAAVFDLAWPGHGRRLVDGDLARRRERAYVRVTKDELALPTLEVRVERVVLDDAHRLLYDAMSRRVTDWAMCAAPSEAEAAAAGRAVMHLLAAATNPAAVLARGLPWSLPADPPKDPVLSAVLDDPRGHIRPVKIIRAAQIVAENRLLGRKTVVWSSFVDNVAALTAALAVHEPAVIVGSTALDDPRAVTDRRRELARFRADPSCWALVATPQTLGEGISLHRTCVDQIHVDRGYAAGTWLQAIDRTHRLGLAPDAKPRCTVLVAADTIDERVAEVLEAKVAAMARALADRALLPIADPALVSGDPAAAVLGDVDALRELLGLDLARRPEAHVRPGPSEAIADAVEVENVVAAGSVHGEPTAGEVHVVEVEVAELG